MPPAALSAVVGFAVAGGRSTRMGRDKATLPWDAGDLLDHAVQRLAALTTDVRILCGPQARYEDRARPVHTDVIPDAGAMAALLTALRALPPEGRAVLLAVDMPLVPVPLLHHLLRRSAEDGADAVVPVTTRGAEPLCAVYGGGCGPAAERAVAAGRLKMTSFWDDVRVCVIGDEELLQAFGDPARLFLNVNTPEDLAAARAFSGLSAP